MQTRRALNSRNMSWATDEFVDYYIQRLNDECSYSEKLPRTFGSVKLQK